MSQPKKNYKRARTWGIILGVVLAIACQGVPDEYKAACNVVAEITAAGCGG